MIVELTSEGKEELNYVIETNNEFPTYKCPFVSNMCYLKYKDVNARWYNREMCIRCKDGLKFMVRKDRLVVK